MTETDTKNNVAKPGLFGRLRAWFFTGLLVTAPVLLTVYITWAAMRIDSLQALPGSSIISGDVPGVGLVIGAVLITLIGAIALGLGRYIIRLGEAILNRCPLSDQFMLLSKFWKRLFQRNLTHFVKLFWLRPRKNFG